MLFKQFHNGICQLSIISVKRAPPFESGGRRSILTHSYYCTVYKYVRAYHREDSNFYAWNYTLLYNL